MIVSWNPLFWKKNLNHFRNTLQESSQDQSLGKSAKPSKKLHLSLVLDMMFASGLVACLIFKQQFLKLMNHEPLAIKVMFGFGIRSTLHLAGLIGELKTSVFEQIEVFRIWLALIRANLLGNFLGLLKVFGVFNFFPHRKYFFQSNFAALTAVFSMMNPKIATRRK